MELPDIQKTKSDFSFSLDKVGIKDIIKNVKIVKDSETLEFSAKFSAFINLPKDLKGIHMSRNPETIQDVLNELTYKPVSNIESLMRKLSEQLLNKHEYASVSEVTLNGTLVIEFPNDQTGKLQRAYPIRAKSTSTKENDNITTRVLLGISAYGINACPCAQDLMRDYAKEIIFQRKETHGLDEESINNILDIIPLATHSQRSKASVFIEIPEDLNVDLINLINIAEESMSAKVQDVLKRSDEAKLVRLAHLNPKFVEDSCREMASKIVEQFPEFPDDCEVVLTVESYESIHTHNAYAEKRATFKELREEINSS